MKQLKPRLKLLLGTFFLRQFRWLVGLVAVLVLVGGYFLLIDQKIADVRRIGFTDVQTKQQELEERRDYWAKLTDMVERYRREVTPDDVAFLDRILPSEIDIPDLLEILTDLAAKSGTQVGSVSFSEVSAGGAAATAAAPTDDLGLGTKTAKSKTSEKPPAVKATTNPSGLQFLTINLTLTAPVGYPALKNFLVAVEASDRLFDVSALQFNLGSTQAGPTARPTDGQYNLTMTTPYLPSPKGGK